MQTFDWDGLCQINRCIFSGRSRILFLVEQPKQGCEDFASLVLVQLPVVVAQLGPVGPVHYALQLNAGHALIP